MYPETLLYIIIKLLKNLILNNFLAVCDVLYKHKEPSEDGEGHDDVRSINDENESSDSDNDTSEECDEYKKEFDDTVYDVGFILETVTDQIVPDITDSPLKNEFLQSKVKHHQAAMHITVQEIKLVLDCNTRLNSLISMLEKFLSVSHNHIS